MHLNHFKQEKLQQQTLIIHIISRLVLFPYFSFSGTLVRIFPLNIKILSILKDVAPPQTLVQQNFMTKP